MDFNFSGSTYSLLPYNAADFAFGSVVLDPITLDGNASVTVVAAASVTHAPPVVDVVGLVSIGVVASGEVAHGVAAAGAMGVAVTAAAVAAHGVAAQGVAPIAVFAAAAVHHPRYELRGVVQIGGVPVNRRVRAYLRSTGELVGEADTVAGEFAIHTGFAPAEHYVVPIDMSEDATDWKPPSANRVLSVLAEDA